MTSEWVIAAASAVNVLVIIVLAAVTNRYANETKRIAEATRGQAEASARMADEARKEAEASRAIADATLRPAIFHWIPGQQVPAQGEETVLVNYQNIGSGPAANIHWSLDPESAGRITVTPRRVVMDVREGPDPLRTKLKFPLPDGGVFVVARYGDLTGTTWESRLRLVMENGNLGNGESTFRRVEQ